MAPAGVSNPSGVKGFLVNLSGGVVANRLVKLVAPDTAPDKAVAYTTTGEEHLAIGTTEHDADDGDPVAVRLLTPGQTVKVTAGAAVTLTSGRVDLVCGPLGKVIAHTSEKARIAQGVQAATGDGSIVEAIAGYQVLQAEVAAS